MAKKAKPENQEFPQPEVLQPEAAPVEAQSVPVSLVDDDTEEMPAPVTLVVEEAPAPIQLAPEPAPVVVRPLAPAQAAPVEPLIPAGQVENKPGLLKWMFDPATPRGRSMRTFARWAAIVIGLLAAGFLVAYMSLYQPAMQQLETSREESALLKTQLMTTQGQLEDVQGELRDVKASLLESENTNAETEAQLSQLNIRRQVLEALYLVTDARLYWISNNQALTLSTLVKVETIFTALQPEIESRSSDLAKLVDQQLGAAMSDIVKNAPSTPSSLEKLYRTVNSLQELFTDPAQ